MAIPEEVLKVERPVNTIVKKIGDKYAVIQRIGCVRKNGKNYPVDGKVIGHIRDLKYVKKESPQLAITLKKYADFKVANSLGESLLGELEKVYGDHAKGIYVMALLRALNPNLTDSRMQEEYEESFISETFKDLSLGKSKVSSFIEKIGKDFAKIISFMHNRVDSIDERNRIAIDGMLKTNNSRINTLSDFSYKGRIKSSKDISILVAFNASTKEIICSLPYQGNRVDATSFPDFIEKTGIRKGLVITDKAGIGIDGMKGIGFIHPMRRNSQVLEKGHMYEMDGVLKGKDEPVECKKATIAGLFYYGYRDVRRAAKEKKDFLRSRYDRAKLKRLEPRFGTVVYVSDIDMTPEEAYGLYKDRWEIELVNKFYKMNITSTTREHSDYSVYGSEFINFLSSVIANRMKNRFSDLGLLKEYTYGDVMRFLRRGTKMFDPVSKQWSFVKQTNGGLAVLSKLGI